MRLPHLLLDSPYFQYSSLAELIKALGEAISPNEIDEIKRLDQLGIPPISSRLVLAALLGVNPGLIWSMQNRTNRYYRHFSIPKGNGHRNIAAPKVALKIFQKWLSARLDAKYQPPAHVYGFVTGRSHVQAAQIHVGARWVYSVDIRDFFPSTPQSQVQVALARLGYAAEASTLIAQLCCLNGALAQGAPTSPVLSNICFQDMDQALLGLATAYGAKLSRYADDVVFSGDAEFNPSLGENIAALFEGPNIPWSLAPEKVELMELPARLKVHGLLVHGESVRLTKGYRHRLRAYRHLLSKDGIQDADLRKVKGHLAYGDYIESFIESNET